MRFGDFLQDAMNCLAAAVDCIPAAHDRSQHRRKAHAHNVAHVG
jgi:hypothetical protein